MANVFTVRDPGGLPVHLSQRVWRSHILFRHQFMARYLEQMKVTISRPVRTYANTDYEEGVSYWKRGLGSASQRDRWLTVVVNYKQARITRRWYGEVVTAYFALETPPESERIHDDE